MKLSSYEKYEAFGRFWNEMRVVFKVLDLTVSLKVKWSNPLSISRVKLAREGRLVSWVKLRTCTAVSTISGARNWPLSSLMNSSGRVAKLSFTLVRSPSFRLILFRSSGLNWSTVK